MSVICWTTGSGNICLDLTKEQAQTGYHQGACDDDIADLRQVPAIAQQLSTLEPDTVRAELREYGAWNAVELADHNQNLSRLLWLACADIVDNPEIYA